MCVGRGTAREFAALLNRRCQLISTDWYTTRGASRLRLERAPTRPGQVLVGREARLGHGGGAHHMDVPHLRPDGVRAAAQHALHDAEWAGDGADLHKPQLKCRCSFDLLAYAVRMAVDDEERKQARRRAFKALSEMARRVLRP
jgi:hypothetical protein